jgi:manganese/zinc/iron transport system substrate-binding protein
MKKIFTLILVAALIVAFTVACADNSNVEENGKYNVVTTTTIVGDLVKQIADDKVNVISLMGSGVDPHLYKASAGDVTKMQGADLVVYSGLHLEGKMGDVFENLRGGDKLIVSAAGSIDKDKLLDFITVPGSYDPHVWFDVDMWKEAAGNVLQGLIELDSDNEETFKENYELYIDELDELEEYIVERISEVPEGKRVLITAHDAFQYFGRAYGFQVKGLQGISTDAEAGTSDVRKLADLIVEKEIKAIFVESSVPRKNIEALQEAVKAQGFDVEIGGELYSDSTGDGGTPAETYIGTFKENIDTIVDALK